MALVESNFCMPAEWEKHEGCWMGWPENPAIWRNHALYARKAFAEVAKAISQFEPVTICASAEQWKYARDVLPPHIRVVEMSQNDAWFRDTGPTFVISSDAAGTREVVGVDWKFNSWGGLLPCDKDDQIAYKICQLEKLRTVRVNTVLEGGAVHVDGEGTLITTEECLLHPSRNPSLSKDDIEDQLKKHLGVEKVIWIPRGLDGDYDTDGHVDNVACFAAPGVVLLAWTDDKADPQYERSKEALEVLEASTDAKGRPIKVLKLPLPPAMYATEEELVSQGQGDEAPTKDGTDQRANERLPNTYINFYLANGGVVMPSFGVAECDQAALEVVQAAFPDRKVVQVDAREIILGRGGIHCITCQQPAA